MAVLFAIWFATGAILSLMLAAGANFRLRYDFRPVVAEGRRKNGNP